MIVYRTWKSREDGGKTIVYHEGWYLFGLIPLYIREVRDNFV